MENRYLDRNGLMYVWEKIRSIFLSKEDASSIYLSKEEAKEYITNPYNGGNGISINDDSRTIDVKVAKKQGNVNLSFDNGGLKANFDTKEINDKFNNIQQQIDDFVSDTTTYELTLKDETEGATITLQPTDEDTKVTYVTIQGNEDINIQTKDKNIITLQTTYQAMSEDEVKKACK